MTTTEVVQYATEPLSARHEYAQALASAGDLIPKGLHHQPRDPNTNAASGPAVPSVGKVLLVLETGAMLGIHPVAALQGIHVIEGKATLSAATMSAVVRAAGHNLRVWTEGSMADGTFKAIATLVRQDDPEFTYRVEWDRDRADRAGLLGKDNWRNYFEQMAKNRAVSEVCREGATDALAGVIYTPEELNAPVDERGDVVVGQDGDPAPAAPPTAAATKQPAAGRQGTRRAPKADAPAPEPTPAAPAPETAEQAAVDTGADTATGEVPDTAADDAAAKKRVAENRAAREQADASQAEEDLQRQADAAEAEEAARQQEQDDDPNIVDAEIVPDDAPMALGSDAPADGFDAALRDVQRAAESGDADWASLLPQATTVPQVKAIWDGATAAQQLTTDLRAAIVARKAEVEAA